MASDENGDKTEDPTERKLNEAREKGNVAKSQDLSSAGVMLAAASALAFYAFGIVRSLGGYLQTSLSQPGWINVDKGFVTKLMWDTTEFMASVMLPMMLLIMSAALFVNWIQIGFIYSPESLLPKLGRINPLAGAKRILSIQAVMKLGVSLGKIALLVGIAYWSINSVLPLFLALAAAEPKVIMAHIIKAVTSLALQMAVALIVLSLADFMFQKWKHLQELKMTKQEVRDEMKNMDGDPLIRQRRREAHQKLVQARQMNAVPDADVVITNPTHFAVALKYDKSMGAPLCLAKGADAVAFRIRALAQEHDVPIVENPPLARALFASVEVDETIPAEHFKAVAQVIGFVMRLKAKPSWRS